MQGAAGKGILERVPCRVPERKKDMYYRSDLGNGQFRNPVLFADYSDPDVIRVGDTYYMTASSFNYTPGLPILVSKDLVSWTLAGYALDSVGEAMAPARTREESAAVGERYFVPRHSEGVWAPAIRFHEGTFYIFYGMPDEGIYMVRTKDPLGRWEEPICLLEGKGYIDPCPFWDSDGRAYVIHGYAKSRIGFNSILGIFEMSPDGTRALSGDSFIFDGNDPAHPAKTIEGPKVYKRNDWYYILAPAGGVRKGWQCALRSRSVHGPYEIRTVMDQGESLINGPHQGALVDTAEGDEWFFHFQDRGLYGRICHLQPVSWREDWPVIGHDPMDRGCGQPVFTMEKPAGDKAPDVSPCYLESSDDFPEGRIGLQWQWMGNARAAAGAMGLPLYSPLAEGGIRLHAVNLSGEASPILWHSANVLTQKLVLPEFVCDIRMRLTGLVEGDRAGIAMTGGQYALLYVRKEAAGACLVYAESEGGDRDKKEKILTEIPLPGSVGGRDPLGEMTFRLIFARRSCYRVTPEGEAVPLKEDIPDLFFAGDEAEKPALSLFWSPDGEEFSGAGCEYVPSDHTWVGAKIGVFALSEDEEGGYADLVSVRTEKIG